MATAAALKPEPTPSAGPGLFHSPRQQRMVLSLALGLLTLVVYNSTAANGFVNYDDPDYVTRNSNIQSGLNWQSLYWALTSTDLANWHPVTWLSHTFDYQLFHLRPAGHHYTSLLVHLLTAILLFLFLEKATGMAWRSAVVAALFAVHPVSVESVAWVAERKNLLCTLFFVLGLWAYQRYAQAPNLKRYLLVAGSYAFGLMSKPMVVTFPFVLLLMDYWPLGRMNFSPAEDSEPSTGVCARQPLGKLILEKLPLFALTAASVAITVIAQSGDSAIRLEYPFSLRAANAIVSYARYLGKAFWPSNLAPMYPFPFQGLPAWEVVGGAVLLLSITAAVLILKEHRYLAFGWFWFLGTLVPTIGLVQVGEQAMADRYAYIPFIGLFIAAVWGLSDWLAGFKHERIYLGTAAATALIAFSVIAHQQIAYWRNPVALWTHTLSVTRDNFIAENNLGAALLAQRNVAGARQHFQAGVDINPKHGLNLLDLGVCDMQTGDTQSAIAHLQSALRTSHDPGVRALAFSNLGTIYRTSGDFQAAAQNYIAALALSPENALALYGMGLIDQKAGKLNQAIIYYSYAVHAQPSDVGLVLLAQALAKSHRNAEAGAVFARAKESSSDISVAMQAVDHLLR